jgi:hypothetical protein
VQIPCITLTFVWFVGLFKLQSKAKQVYILGLEQDIIIFSFYSIARHLEGSLPLYEWKDALEQNQHTYKESQIRISLQR